MSIKNESSRFLNRIRGIKLTNSSLISFPLLESYRGRNLLTLLRRLVLWHSKRETSAVENLLLLSLFVKGVSNGKFPQLFATFECFLECQRGIYFLALCRFLLWSCMCKIRILGANGTN